MADGEKSAAGGGEAGIWPEHGVACGEVIGVDGVVGADEADVPIPLMLGAAGEGEGEVVVKPSFASRLGEFPRSPPTMAFCGCGTTSKARWAWRTRWASCTAAVI